MLKSLSTQFAAALFFGPLGLAYSSVAAAVFLTLILAVLYFTELGSLAILIVWPISIVTGLVFTKLHNDRMRNAGSRLLLGPGEEGDAVSAAGSWGRGIAVLSVMAIAGYLAFIYFPNKSSSKIGRIVDAQPATNTSTSNAEDLSSELDPATTAVTPAAETANKGTFTVVTLDQQKVTPVIIGTSSGPDDAPVRVLYVDAAVVNMRSGPGTANSIVVQLERGEELRELGRNEDWINVTVVGSGSNGWVFDRLVSTTQQ